MVAGNLNHPDGQPTTPGSGFPIPPGYGKPGYKPESKVGPYIGVTAVLTLIMVTVVVLRVYTRIAIARSFGWDDGLIVAAAVATVGMHAPYGFLYKYGMGQHLVDSWAAKEGPKNFAKLPYYGFISYHFHTFAIYFIKMSILAFLHRILSLRKTRYVVYVLYVIVTGFMVICFCLVCFQCTPVRAFWSKAILKPGSYKCLPLGHVLSFVNLSNAVIDVVILVVPIPVIMKIQLQRKEKIIVVLIFAVGGLAAIAAIVRVAQTFTFGKYPDITWSLADLMLTAAIEIHLGIICCSVPSLKKFATQVLGMGGNTNTSRSGSIPMHRQKTSVVYPTSESTEEFRPDFTPLEHKYASPHNNRVTIKAVNRDTLDCDEELQVPPPGHIAVKMEYTQITSVVAGEGSVV